MKYNIKIPLDTKPPAFFFVLVLFFNLSFCTPLGEVLLFFLSFFLFFSSTKKKTNPKYVVTHTLT